MLRETSRQRPETGRQQPETGDLDTGLRLLSEAVGIPNLVTDMSSQTDSQAAHHAALWYDACSGEATAIRL